MKNKSICVLTGTRAEYGLLSRLIMKLQYDPEVELQLLVTGTHLDKKFGNTVQEIKDDGIKNFDEVKIPLDNETKEKMAINMGAAIGIFAHYLTEKKPDIIVILGDRYEAFSAACAAYILGIPIAHISGGDLTEGALDDGFRHCITKMSALHFPGCTDSKRRIIQMGEQPNCVYEVGDPGVENCLRMNYMTLDQLNEDLQTELKEKKYGVVTYHPVTQNDTTGEHEVRELIKALDHYRDSLSFIITIANADTGGDSINTIWMDEAKHHDNWLVVSSLGARRYLSAVKHSLMVIGNSSSGIVEAPALKVATINIGDRQKGRQQACSIINCNPEETSIVNSIQKVSSLEFQNKLSGTISCFGEGNTSEDIHNTIKAFLGQETISRKKIFYDIRLPEFEQ